MMVSTRSIERSNFGGEKRSIAPPPELVARIAKLNREARAAGLIKENAVVVADKTPKPFVRAVPSPVVPKALTADQAKDIKALIRSVAEECMCVHCAPDDTDPEDYDENCSTEECASCRTLARVKAALEL